MSRNAILSLAIAASWGMLACQSTPEAPPPPDTGSEFSEAPVKIEEVVEEGDEIALEVIYFDFDRSEILESERANLRFNAKAIKSFRA
ncbi:MAG: hypothetical protein VCB99_09975, partial [Myxococcota bacterium]